MRRQSSFLGAWPAAALVVALCIGAPASRAQISPTNNGPIDVTADSSEFSNQTCITVWSGSAEALQADSRLRANVIKAVLKKKPAGAKPATAAAGSPEAESNCGNETERLEATGDVFYVTPTQMARSDNAIYTADDSMIVMTGNVVVVQGKNVARGDRMTINTQTRLVQLFSDAKGRGTPGRVRAVLFPSQNGGPGVSPFGAAGGASH
jgi:lipopolysaccharide export system protein LptA